MHPLIAKYFDKQRIDPAKLTDDEKHDFDRWQKVLSPEPKTVEGILQFTTELKKIIEGEMSKWDNSTQKNERLIVAQSILNNITRFITAPDTERASLEKYLESLIDSKEEKTL